MYPEWVKHLPQVDVPFPGAVGWLMASPQGQVVFWEFRDRVEVPPHRHGPQMGVILGGRTVMTIDGETRVWLARETFSIADQVEHSAVVDSGSYIIEFYQEPDRHTAQVKKSNFAG